MTTKEHAITKQNLLKFHFGQYREMWSGKHSDDRCLVCNIYDQLMDAAKAMESVTNNYVWVAFNHKFREDERTMCDIIKRFTGRYPVCGSGACESEYYPNQL